MMLPTVMDLAKVVVVEAGVVVVDAGAAAEPGGDETAVDVTGDVLAVVTVGPWAFSPPHETPARRQATTPAGTRSRWLITPITSFRPATEAGNERQILTSR